MRSIRRVGVLAAAGILLTAAATGSAGAQTPASYTGSASGYALKLALGSQNLTAGSSAATATSTGSGEATGAGVLSPAQASTIATAKNPPGETKPEVCGDSALNAVETALRDIVKLGLGCGSASATGAGAESVATATGKVAALDVSLANAIDALPIATQVEGVVNQIDGGVTTICAAVPPLPGSIPLPDPCDTVDTTVSALLSAIQAGNLVSTEIGTSVSGLSVSGASVTSESTAAGAVIKIVPTPTINGVALGEPLATITVARANAKVVCDLNSGNAVPSFDPALIRIKLGSALAALLPAATDPIPAVSLPPQVAAIIGGNIDPTISYKAGELTVTPGAQLVLFPGTPIETEIVAGAGTSKVNPDRSATASADGVKVHALKNIGTAAAPLAGGLLLNLAHAEAAGACVAATVTPPVVETPRELPRTGGTPWLPAAGVAALAVAVVTRRALARSH